MDRNVNDSPPLRLAFNSFGLSGEPLVILHGLFGSRENWHPVCRRLATKFRVFALDLRNHGESPHAAQMGYPAMAADVEEFLARKGLAPAHLLGHSMGAKVAMQLALHRPLLVRSLISVDMAPRAYESRHDRALEGLLALDLEALHSRRQIEGALERWVPEVATRRFLLKNVRRAATGLRWRIGLHEIARNYRRLNEAVAGEPYPGPVLFLRGETSDYLGNQDLPEIWRLFPNAQLHTIPRAGHLVHAENPGAFVHEVLQFLAPKG